MRVMIFVTFALLAGCASSIEQLTNVRDGAPEWFDARKTEISGKDYPSIANVPVVTAENAPGQQLEQSGADTRAALAMFNSDPRAEGPQEDAASMLAWAAAAKREVEREETPADFMTDAEIAELKSVFDTPRGR